MPYATWCRVEPAYNVLRPQLIMIIETFLELKPLFIRKERLLRE
jgi:hypothetical protein